jgi:signal transduction histidine kinase
VALAAAFALGSVLEGLLQHNVPYRAVTIILTVGLTPTLLWRRTNPLPMLVIAFLVDGLAPLATGGVPPSLGTMVYFLALPYALLRWGSGRDVVRGCLVLAAKVAVWVIAGFSTPGDELAELAILTITVAVGTAMRYRARARARELDHAKLLERERLARDLHDTVAHHVSAMAIRAQAGLAMSASQPEAAPEALRLIEAEASRALAEMRAMVRLMRRDQPAELAPNPSIADLGELAARPRTGPVVDVLMHGDIGTVPPSVGAAIYRLAQESVTNARRHARHATRIEVHVAADEAAVRLRVSDDGEGAHPRVPGAPGYGLVGMAERAGLLGGTCEAGPNPDRGWTVTAVLPRAGASG